MEETLPIKQYYNTLSEYEKTIFTLAVAWKFNQLFCLSEKDILKLSELLSVNHDLLHRALNDSELALKVIAEMQSDNIDKCYSFIKSGLFSVIVLILLMYQSLDNIFDDANEDEIRENIKEFRNVFRLFDSANSTMATYECITKSKFSYDYTVFNSAEHFSPNDYNELLEYLINYHPDSEYDKDILAVISLLLKYEFLTRINALYLIAICQILKHSPCFDSTTICIAEEFYYKFLSVLNNGKLIAINIEHIPMDPKTPCNSRTKENRTSRLQLFYGYSNYDCYEMRLDFSHKGQELVHYNNESPGKLSCCIFSKAEYEAILEKHPKLESCFISYDNNRWALKERNNCILCQEMTNVYEETIKSKSHDKAFLNDYSEDNIDDVVQMIAQMLPNSYKRHIDTDGKFAQYCFNCDMIVRDVTILVASYLSLKNNEDDIQKEILAMIADKSFRYGLKPEKTEINSFCEVKEILQLAINRVLPNT